MSSVALFGEGQVNACRQVDGVVYCRGSKYCNAAMRLVVTVRKVDLYCCRVGVHQRHAHARNMADTQHDRCRR